MNDNGIKCLGDNGVCIPSRTYSYEKKKTNADKIRAMSDKELAEYIFGLSIGNAHCVLCSEECDFCELSDEECKLRTLKWLQSEAE